MKISVNDVRVRYRGAIALDGVNVKFPSGTLSAIVGRNGAGKTSLLQAIAGLVPLTTGTIVWEDEIEGRLTTRTRAQPNCRFVPESENIFPDLTVVENLHSGVMLLRRRERERRVGWAFEEFPLLRSLGSRKGSALSGGERQTLAVARAAIARPRVLLVDEPSLGLSPNMAIQLVESLLRLAQGDGATVILAEQNWEVAARAASLIHLETGHVVRQGSPAEVAPRLVAEEVRRDGRGSDLGDTGPETPASEG